MPSKVPSPCPLGSPQVPPALPSSPSKSCCVTGTRLLPSRGDVPSPTAVSFETGGTRWVLHSQCVNTCSSAPTGVPGLLPRPVDGLLCLINSPHLSSKSPLPSRGATRNAVSPVLLPSGGSQQNKAVTQARSSLLQKC